MIDDAIFAATCAVSCGDVCGTGYLVRPDRVLTARHCVIKALESNAPIELTFSRIPLDNEERRVIATLVAESAGLDACILAIESIPTRVPLPITDVPPREGLSWKTFGFPVSKGLLGHRLYGAVQQVFPKPKAKVDIDLSVDPSVFLESYKGLSGAPVVVHERCVGIMRLRADRSVAAISIRSLSALLTQHDIPIGKGADQEPQRPHLAGRSAFQQQLEAALITGRGRYFFLEGAHGIGKTTFCQYFAPADPRLLHFGTYCVLEPTGDSNTLVRSDAEVLHDWLVTTVSAHLSGKAARHERKTYPQMAQDVSALLNDLDRHCAQRQRIGVLFIDGLNEVQSADPMLLPYFVGLLPSTLPAHVALVLSSPSYAGVASFLSGRVPADNVRTVPLLSESASIAYCSNTLTGARASDYEFIRQLCKKANGHPLYLNYLIRHASAFSDASLDDFPVLDGPIEEYYERVWQTISADEHAVHLLSIMARLREDLPFDAFVNALNAGEQAVFVPTIARIQHLMLQPDHTTIYHASFRDYIVGKTRQLEQVIHARLAAFCLAHGTRYCIRNKVFHLLRGSPENRAAAAGLCTQEWVDECVVHSAPPDVLLSDVEAVVEAVFRAGQPVDAIRLLLLRQRVSFRYDTVFAQSAGLLAHALVALGRPREALTHVIRHGALIMSNGDALRSAYAFIQHEYFDEALQVLDMIVRRCIGFYSVGEFPVQQFVEVTVAHIQAVLLSRLADGESHMREVQVILEHARRAINASISDASFRRRLLQNIGTLPAGYFLAFCDTYATVQEVAKRITIPKREWLQMLAGLVLHYMEMVEEYRLSKPREAINALLKDVEALVRSRAKVEDNIVPLFVDALIRLGAPVPIVAAISARHPVIQPQEVKLRGPDGVDAEIQAVLQNGFAWRAKGFLGSEAEYPSIPGYGRETWLSSLESAFAFVFYCEGRARRAKAEGDGKLLCEVGDVFRRDFFAAVRFSLAERMMWDRSYALPETSVPFLFECAAELIFDCYPDLLEPLIDFLQSRCQDQLGLYTEGFRECICRVIGYISHHELQARVKVKLISLLNALKDHIITGVENRHEMVPELLRLVRLYAGIGAKELAENVYRDVLRFSMGPSWYKENQFSLMTTALAELSLDDGFYKRLPSIAGNLERASGEMTFQRFVRHHKSDLIGVLSAHALLRAACGYFRAESCGDMSRLFSEWESGKIDLPHPRRGNRFPGGALDEQAAILEIVKNAQTVDWRLRWALLEVFQFGDSRYVEQYAREYASLYAEAAEQLSPGEMLVSRFHAVLIEELEPDETADFINALYQALRPEHRPQFHSLLSTYGSPGPKEGPAEPEKSRAVADKPDPGKDPEPDLYAPGLFGKRDSITTAEGELADARAQFQLANTEAAKQLLVSALSTVQAGGWTIWDRPAACSIEAEGLLKETASDASDLTARYAPLVAGERYAASWKIADHLITQVGSLLSGSDRQRVLDHILEHIRLMIGDAAAEEDSFRFLEDASSSDPSAEVFRFIVSLVDHPVWIRRERAAEMLLWLVDLESGYTDLAIDLGFEMSLGFGADVLCGILDILSHDAPVAVWERVGQRVNLEKFLSQVRHTGRFAILYLITRRARDAGSKSAAPAHARIASMIRDGAIELGASEDIALPRWADCIADRWKRLEELGVTTLELRDAVQTRLAAVCYPYRIDDARNLEAAVSASFRAPARMPLNRWEAKVHFSLCAALFPYLSVRNIERAAGALRVFSPTAPCRSRSVGHVVLPIAWSPSMTDYSTLIGDAEYYYMHYHGVHQNAQGQMQNVLVVAVFVPSSTRRRALFVPEIQAAFRSGEHPSDQTEALPHETCRHVIPEPVFFGSYTPAYLLGQLEELDRPGDVRRINWKRGRAKETEYYGAPFDEGCALAVRKSAVILPEGSKLAWIVVIDGRVQAIVDADNNELY